ncbi:MAG: hypothetical protein ACJKTH_03410 [Patescibacteria group bacterium UBA2163]
MLSIITRVLHTKKIFLLPAVFIVLVICIAIGRYVFAPECFEIQERVPKEGSQGFQTWYGEHIKSFYHRDKKHCIPEGWRAIGATEVGEGWARFASNQTGVMVADDTFASFTITPNNTHYSLFVLYPQNFSEAERLRYARVIENTFNRVGALFNDTDAYERTQHTVLITAGVANELIYPDPRENLTIFVRELDDPRSEELFIHAVVHVYNRFAPINTTYQHNQAPLNEGDIQEFEATWAETAFNTNEKNRANRVEYLYTVHSAVLNKNFEAIPGPPFDDREAFMNINPRLPVYHDASEIDIQYNHYILAPLIFIAIDGLLNERATQMNVERILTRIHSGEATNFFNELNRYITEEDTAMVLNWIQNAEPIPPRLLEEALTIY